MHAGIVSSTACAAYGATLRRRQAAYRFVSIYQHIVVIDSLSYLRQVDMKQIGSRRALIFDAKACAG